MSQRSTDASPAIDAAVESQQRAWLLAHQSARQEDHSQLSAKERSWGWARLFTFAAAASAWYPLTEKLGASADVALVATLVLLGVFVYCVRQHLLAKGRRELIDRILEMLDESLRRCGGAVELIRSHDRPEEPASDTEAVTAILDDGPTYSLTQQECLDLDLYAAPVGILGLLNRTSTRIGLRRLCKMLENPCISLDHIKRRQEAIYWLDHHSDRRIRILGATAILRNKDKYLEQLVAAVHTAKALPSPGRVFALRIWSLVTLIVTVIAIVKATTGAMSWSIPWVVLLVLNGCQYARMRKLLNESLAPFKTVAGAAEGLLHATTQGAEDLPDQGELARLRECFALASRSDCLPAFCSRVKWCDSGGMIYEFFNTLFFYDLHVADSILKCTVQHQKTLTRCLAALADLEALTSLGCFAFESRGVAPVSYPNLTDERKLAIRTGRHPLIPPSQARPNDLHLDTATRMYVITGSNMAGKSTYLRMCGGNFLLAQVGSAVLAEEMTLSPLRLISDLQVSDNLAEKESYFLAEVRHLRRMIIPDTDSIPMFGLMDEPFRGTNSGEQVAAALAVANHLLQTDGFFLVATHEQKLAELADRSEGSVNHHFSENLEAQGLVFDYALRDGPARSRNALRVLEREGYPDELMKKARKWLDAGTDEN